MSSEQAPKPAPKPAQAPGPVLKRRFQRYGAGLPRRSVESTHPADTTPPAESTPTVQPKIDPTKKK